MIVVDTNIIGYLFLTSDQSEQAEQALVKDPAWAAPLLWRSEFHNVLLKYMRKGIFDLAAAQEIMSAAASLVQDREFEVASSQVLTLAAASTCSAYDCEFAALAQDLGVRLLTVDRQILHQFPQAAISLEAYLDQPAGRA